MDSTAGAGTKSTSHDEESLAKKFERHQDDSTRRSFKDKTKQFESLKADALFMPRQERIQQSLKYKASQRISFPEIFQIDESEGFKPDLRCLLVGKAGAGKSTTGNTILGSQKFQTAPGFSSETSQCEIQRGVINGLQLEIIDSPGLFDTAVSDDQIAKKIVQTVACLHPGPHAFLFVIKITRFTKEEEDTYNRLIALFNEDVTKHMIIVFTERDKLKSAGQTIEEALDKAPDGLKHILNACGGRYVFFDNTARYDKHQVNRFVDIAQKMVRENCNKPYICPEYMSVGDTLKEEIQRRMRDEGKIESDYNTCMQQVKEGIARGEEKSLLCKLLETLFEIIKSVIDRIRGTKSD